MNGGQHRRLYQAAVRKRQKVEVVMNQVKLGGVLKNGGDMQALPNFGVKCFILRVGARADSRKFRSSDRVSRSKQRHLKTALNQALRAIMTEGRGLAAIAPQLAILAAWGVLSFAAALKIFRWR